MIELTEWQEIKEFVEREARTLLERCHIDRPPVDTFSMAEFLGLGVQIDSSLKARGYSRRRWDIRTVVVGSKNPGKSERKHFTIAHEIGETLLAGKVSERFLEDASNHMAISLLMPGEWFSRDAEETTFDLFRLKERYSTASHEVIAFRMLELRPMIVTIFDNNRLYRRKSSYPMPVDKLYPLEGQCLKGVMEKAEVMELEDERLRVWGWPVFREDWKRVILRTELIRLSGL